MIAIAIVTIVGMIAVYLFLAALIYGVTDLGAIRA